MWTEKKGTLLRFRRNDGLMKWEDTWIRGDKWKKIKRWLSQPPPLRTPTRAGWSNYVSKVTHIWILYFELNLLMYKFHNYVQQARTHFTSRTPSLLNTRHRFTSGQLRYYNGKLCCNSHLLYSTFNVLQLSVSHLTVHTSLFVTNASFTPTVISVWISFSLPFLFFYDNF